MNVLKSWHDLAVEAATKSGVNIGLDRAIKIIERWKVEGKGKAWYHIGPMLTSLIEEIQTLKEQKE